MMKKMPRRHAALRKELEALGASAKKTPGEARWCPLLALPPNTLIKGKRYVGWICRGCGDRLELGETTYETPEPVHERSLPWAKCHCGHLDQYRWNARTTATYRRAGAVAT